MYPAIRHSQHENREFIKSQIQLLKSYDMVFNSSILGGMYETGFTFNHPLGRVQKGAKQKRGWLKKKKNERNKNLF